MGKFAFLSLALLAVQALFVRAEDTAADTAENVAKETLKTIPEISVNISTTFPDSEVFGVKLINGKPTQAQVKVTNNEPDPITVSVIGGTLWTLSEPSQNVRNLTMTRYSVEVPSKSEETVTYSFSTELLPQELNLNLAAVVSRKDGFLYTIPAFNGTVSVVEPEMSIFDPQVLAIFILRTAKFLVRANIRIHSIFLYFFVLASFVGASYFFYTLWIAPYFPQKRKPVKTHDRAKKPSRQQAGVDAGEPASDTPPVAKTYDAEWIPAHHIHRPEPRKVKSGSGRSKSRA
ncbi:hypothetical protein PRK78_005746 [Emydomyces testavorans]|uniref:Translocon-associated protein subunit alpha n=1 Tax=Emydomyces testavorans TaxID=2070801 RepID=A0AAF0DMS1_9EURO|nr:hypothetical protein PRK78_005746 [Emydomyces testavorans]